VEKLSLMVITNEDFNWMVYIDIKNKIYRGHWGESNEVLHAQKKMTILSMRKMKVEKLYLMVRRDW
jgi:hypothetical protein